INILAKVYSCSQFSENGKFRVRLWMLDNEGQETDYGFIQLVSGNVPASVGVRYVIRHATLTGKVESHIDEKIHHPKKFMFLSPSEIIRISDPTSILDVVKETISSQE